MINKSTDHGNDGGTIFFSLPLARDFSRTFNGNGRQKLSMPLERFRFWDEDDNVNEIFSILSTVVRARQPASFWWQTGGEGQATLVDRNILLYVHPPCTSAMNQIGNRKRHWISNPTVSESVSLAQNWTQDLHCNVGLRIGNDMTKENGGKISNSV